MTEYLVSRAEGAPPRHTPAELMEGSMFFQMWKTRQDPFQVLADGDTLWWVDQGSREIRWELRVANLRRSQYRSLAQAMDRLRRWYGVIPSDLTDYQHNKHHEGWLLAWEHEVVGTVDVTLPAGEQLGRNGFRRIEFDDARRMGLAAPGGRSLFVPAPLPHEPDVLAPPRDRTIPQATKNAVWKRDGEKCGICQGVEGPWHIDHIFPFSKGGTNTLENLRILCAKCNLRKGASIEGGSPLVPVVPQIVECALAVGRAVPATAHEVGQLVKEASKANERSALEAAWALDAHPDTSTEVRSALTTAMGRVHGEEAQLFVTLQNSNGSPGPIEHFALCDDLRVAGRACAEIALDATDPKVRLRHARRAREVGVDDETKAVGALVIGELTEDDQEWSVELFFAHDFGNPMTRCSAALLLGMEVDDDDLAYVLLEEATRAPSPDLAALAAGELSERFAGEPEIAQRYAELQAVLEKQLEDL